MFNNETINSNFSRKIDFQQNEMKSSKGETYTTRQFPQPNQSSYSKILLHEKTLHKKNTPPPLPSFQITNFGPKKSYIVSPIRTRRSWGGKKTKQIQARPNLPTPLRIQKTIACI